MYYIELLKKFCGITPSVFTTKTTIVRTKGEVFTKKNSSNQIFAFLNIVRLWLPAHLNQSVSKINKKRLKSSKTMI